MVQGHNLSGKPCGKIVALQHNQLRVGVEEGCSRMIQIAPAGDGWLMGTHGLLFVISRNIFYPKRNMSISCFLECFAFIGHNWEHFCHIFYAIFFGAGWVSKVSRTTVAWEMHGYFHRYTR